MTIVSGVKMGTATYTHATHMAEHNTEQLMGGLYQH